MNSEILVLLEQAVRSYQDNPGRFGNQVVSSETQVEIWRRLSGTWEDDRSTEEIVDDIYSSRTVGRDVDL